MPEEKQKVQLDVMMSIRVRDHLTAFKLLTESTFEQRQILRRAIREALKSKSLPDVDDAGYMLVYLEEFLNCGLVCLNLERVGDDSKPMQPMGNA